MTIRRSFAPKIAHRFVWRSSFSPLSTSLPVCVSVFSTPSTGETVIASMMKKSWDVLLRCIVASRSSLSGSTQPLASWVTAQSPAAAQTRNFSDGFVAGSSQNVGFIGLGNMGSHMAANLLKAGHSLCILDRNKDAMQAFAAKGASMAKTPLQVAEESDVVITMLPASAHVREVYTGSNGLLTKRGALRPSLLIDCSTIDPQTCRLLASKVSTCTTSSRNFRSQTPIMLDAPVSGGVGGAQAGTLTFMVGGPMEGLTEVLPLLNAMGKRVVHCGGPGNGAAAKVCNNLAMAISMAGVSESFALGQRLGIDAVTLSKIFNSSSARCWSSDTYNPVPGVMDGVPASRDYEGGFSCQLMTKDLGLALTAAEEVGLAGIAVPLAKQVHSMYSTLCETGHSHEDFSSVFRFQYSGEPQPPPAESDSDPRIAQT